MKRTAVTGYGGPTVMARLRGGILVFLFGFLCVGVFPDAAGAASPDIDRELEFASKLADGGFADFAERLVERLVRQDPAVEGRVGAVRAQILVARRRYDEAEALLERLPAGEPATEATRLAVANGLYRAGEIERARALYQAFFDQHRDRPPEDPDVRRFFMDAAYRFGQMMERAGDFDRAIQAYDTLIQASPEPGLARRLRVETADLMLRAARTTGDRGKRDRYLERARELCEEVHWGGLDLWFGRTIPILATIEVVRGRPEEARRVIQSYLDILTEIDKMMREDDIQLAFSPMAGTRFLLGTLFEEEGIRLLDEGKDEEGEEYLGRALREYFNVFARYGDSDWGPEAGTRAEDVVSRLEDRGRTVRVDFGPHRDRAAEAQFRLAGTLFQERRYADAAAGYLRAINAFPGAGDLGRALSNLLMSYIHLGDDLRLRATALYIGDRHWNNAQVGLALLVAGRHYYEEENTEMYRWMYDRFVRSFPRHERTPAALFTLSRLAEEQDDPEGASRYLQALIENFPGDEYYLRALNRQARREYDGGRYEKAADLFTHYVEQSHPSQLRAQSQYLRADSWVRKGNPVEGVELLRELIDWLTPLEGTGYAGTSEELERNRELRTNAAFQVGYVLTRVQEPEEQVPDFRAEAIEELTRFVETPEYRDSALAPQAMNIVGTTLLELDRTEEATETFQQLQERYPDSDVGRSALFALVRAAMEVGQVDIARDALRRMQEHPAEYRPEQFSGVGRIMLDGGQPEDAAAAFRLALDSGTEERRVLERSLFGLGEASYALGRYDDAIEALEEMVERYPRSGRLFEARMVLGRAYRGAGRLPEAVAALREVFQLGTSDALLQNTANIELARVQVRLAERQVEEGRTSEADENFRAALASYQRIAMLVDPEDPELRPLVEESLMQSADIFMRVERFDDVEETVDQYLRDFPEGEQAEAMRRLRRDARLRATGGG